MATLDGVRRQVERRGMEIARQGAAVMQAELRARAPRGKTGQMAAKTTVVATGRPPNITAAVTVDTPYAAAVIGGARPHKIKARDGEALVFGGRFSTEVDHPGIKGNKYFSEITKRWGVYLQRFAS